ncbi:MAG TPA: tetratricopeptide repeat protein [Terriglobales bacterium]
MTSRTLVSLLTIVLFSGNMFAQHTGGGAGTGGGGRPAGGTGGINSTTNPNPGLNLPNNLPSPDMGSRPMFLSGKVVVDDGTPLTDAAIIQTICRGNVRTEGYTDSKGTFSVDLSSMTTRAMVGAADDTGGRDGGSPMSGGSNTRSSVRDVRDCELQAVLPGFTSQQVELASKATNFGNADIGTVVLHRIGHVEGFTISATSAMAPGKAKKLYEQGREEEKKSKWDSAQEKFSKAVEIYPKYAVAWYELGRVQMQKKNSQEAKSSFRQSIAADRTYISPYEQLAQLAMQEQQWKDLSEATDEMLRLNSVSFPQYWLYNSIASYFLRDFDKAQKSAEAGMNIDPKHQVPKLEYILGMVLVQKHDYPNALLHVRNYIRLAPNAPDAELAQKQATELEKMSGSAAVKN